MIIQWEKVKIFIRPGFTDTRKQINGLSVIVDEGLSADPLSGNFYLFINRARKLLKVLYWDKRDSVYGKKLKKDRFSWPSGGCVPLGFESGGSLESPDEVIQRRAVSFVDATIQREILSRH